MPRVVGLMQRAGAGLGPGRFISLLFPQELKQLQFLHLSDNQLDYIPAPLPESLRSLHLQVRQARTQACLYLSLAKPTSPSL